MLVLLNPVTISGSSGARSVLAGWSPPPNVANPDVVAELASIRATGGIFVDTAASPYVALAAAKAADRDSDQRPWLLVAATPYAAYLAAGGGAQTVVRVNSGGTGGAQASPYSANPGETVVCDTSTGNVVVNLPALTSGQSVTIAHDAATSLASNTVTVNRNGTTNLEQPPPSNGTFGASYVIAGNQSKGMSLSWFNGGSSGGLLLE